MTAKTAAVLSLAGLLWTAVPAVASVEPFRLGTFEHRGEAFLGIVLRDAWAVDLAGANASLERHNRMWVSLPMPEDMKELAGRWHLGMRDRVHAIVDQVVPLLARSAEERPVWIHELEGLHVFPPVRPGIILATALNYPAHGVEMTTGAPAAMSDASALDDQQVSMDHFWEREPGDRRQNPYLFLKPGSIAIGHGEPILMKPEREMVDWECELAVVIGRPASDVEAEDAGAHVFGYTMMNDVGDREGRGDDRYGSDWLVWKSTETFAPLGPFITPAEFVADPHDLDIRFTLSGEIMQDANTGIMEHRIPELIQFASHNLILRPGDVIATGTPDGVGYARIPPIFMKPGDTAACWAEGIGTLVNPVRAWADAIR
ncbi:MAG: fumarylacetoacetate hydrolase family protein [Acidobacteria bacterium]|nr:fumarylacetoacetate hydrolase family protein [Acidobacteriota bacterium]MYF14446.1 fumarylacetoacetate hydrolase family protein [Acidobacteriota bacterium]MYI95717.1 fumarylacetoacetate hydrolase family protein [Acidobacteriota bacterium]